RPASMWATGMQSFAPARAPANVELVPPKTITESGSSGRNASMSGNVIVVDGALAGINTFYGPGNSLEFVAIFSGNANQHIGLGTDFNSAPWAIFSTGSGGGLYARTNNGSTGVDTLILGNSLGTAHRYRIDWNTSGIVFSIDGTV